MATLKHAIHAALLSADRAGLTSQEILAAAYDGRVTPPTGQQTVRRQIALLNRRLAQAGRKIAYDGERWHLLWVSPDAMPKPTMSKRSHPRFAAGAQMRAGR